MLIKCRLTSQKQLRLVKTIVSIGFSLKFVSKKSSAHVSKYCRKESGPDMDHQVPVRVAITKRQHHGNLVGSLQCQNASLPHQHITNNIPPPTAPRASACALDSCVSPWQVVQAHSIHLVLAKASASQSKALQPFASPHAIQILLPYYYHLRLLLLHYTSSS